jgi:hypothetical protein
MTEIILSHRDGVDGYWQICRRLSGSYEIKIADSEIFQALVKVAWA